MSTVRELELKPGETVRMNLRTVQIVGLLDNPKGPIAYVYPPDGPQNPARYWPNSGKTEDALVDRKRSVTTINGFPSTDIEPTRSLGSTFVQRVRPRFNGFYRIPNTPPREI